MVSSKPGPLSKSKIRWVLLVPLPLSVAFICLLLSQGGGPSLKSLMANSPPLKPDSPLWGPTAICISGDPYFFDLTGPSLVKHMVDPYRPHAKVFVSTLYSEDSHKITALSSAAPLSSLRLWDLPSTGSDALGNSMLPPHASKEEAESMFAHYFMMQGLVDAVQEHEGREKEVFKWVVVVASDQYWTADFPLPSLLSTDSYTAPLYAQGTEPTVVNEQAGAGGRFVTLPSLERISMVEELTKRSVTHPSPEHAFFEFLSMRNVSVKQTDFQYCSLTEGEGTAIIKEGDDRFLLFSAGSAAATNGVPCKPCKPIPGGSAASWNLLQAFPAAQKLAQSLSDRGLSSAVQLCDPASTSWDEDWQTVFDAQVDEATAAGRQHIATRGDAQCVADVKALQDLVAIGGWKGPSPSSLCDRRSMGPMTHLGSSYGGWRVFPDFLQQDKCTVFSFGIGQDITWDEAVIDTYRCSVFAFDNTPRSMSWLKEKKTPPKWKHVPYLLGVEDGNVSMSLPKAHGVSFVKADDQSRMQMRGEVGVVQLPAKKLGSLMKDLGQERVDVLKIDIEGAEFSILSGWKKSNQVPKACQLLIEFHGRLVKGGEKKRTQAVEDLNSLGFTLAQAEIDKFGGDNCVFFNRQFCIKAQD